VKSTTLWLIAKLASSNYGPTSILESVDGRTRLVWDLKFDNPRYAEAIDSIEDDSVLLVSRSGVVGSVHVAQIVNHSSCSDIVSWVRSALGGAPPSAAEAPSTRDVDRRVGLAVSHAAGVPDGYLLSACFEPLGRAARTELEQLGWVGPKKE